MILWLQQSLLFGAVIMLAAMGELLCEKAGHLNLGTPGILCAGATAGFMGAKWYITVAENPNAFLCILITLVCAFALAAAVALIYSFFTITLRINQNVVGLVITIFGVGLSKFLSTLFVNNFIQSKTGNIEASAASAFFRAKIPFLSDSLGPVSEIVFNYGFMFYLTILLAVLMYLFFSKTRVGLNLRAVGENPATADAAGINVIRYKYLATVIGGGITGLAGIFCVMDFQLGGWSTANIEAIKGYGWLAVALVIFATWKSVNLIWGSFVFGIFYWAYQYLPGVLGVTITTKYTALMQMLPYIITVVMLILISLRKKKENQGPASLGLSYFREDR